MRNFVRRSAQVKALFSACAVALLSLQASAQTIGVDISSDLSSFQPVALGQDIELNPCGSNVVRGNSSQVLNSICTTSEPDRFSINYLISREGTTSALTFGSAGQGVENSINNLVNSSGGTVESLGNASAGLRSVSLATGNGTLFSTAGTYVISLITAMQGGVVINNPTGPNQRTYNDNGLEISSSGFSINGATIGNFDGTVIGTLGGKVAATANGLRNVAFAQATLVVSAASVPEPAGMFVFGVGLLGLGWHQRRRKAARAVAATLPQ